MKNVFLLMKLDTIVHGKMLWRMKWQFLFFFCIFAFAIVIAVSQPPKVFRITYYNGDSSFGSRLAIDNFIRALKEVAEIKEEKDFPEHPEGDAFVYFPEGFAEKWQHFEKFPAEIYILNKNPIFQALLAESFEAYENIMLASESVIMAYNSELDALQLETEEWTNANVAISLEFLSLAFNRNQLYSPKILDTLPASFTKTYFYYSFSLFFGLLLSVYRNASEMERRKQYCRIFLSKISIMEYSLADLLLSIGFIAVYLSVLAGIAKVFSIAPTTEYFLRFALVLLIFHLCMRGLVYVFQSEAEYSIICVSVVFIASLFGGVFLPISFLPSDWIRFLHFSPFYQVFLYLTGQAVTGELWLALSGGGIALLLFLANAEIVRRKEYV